MLAVLCPFKQKQRIANLDRQIYALEAKLRMKRGPYFQKTATSEVEHYAFAILRTRLVIGNPWVIEINGEDASRSASFLRGKILFVDERTRKFRFRLL